MKYKHYAPKADMAMLLGSDEEVLRYFKKALSNGEGVICYEEDLCDLPVGYEDFVFVLGPKNEPLTQAKRLFDVLRAIDQCSVMKVYSRFPSRDGVGLAVFNRLIKACGYQIISAG
jgi:L-threonylcarbamoyladenylate synthase